MSTSNIPAQRETYHHGDLHVALLDAAEHLMDEGGPGPSACPRVPDGAGVSATAAYRHFADKESMLAALAVRGFDAFGAALDEAAAREPDDALAAMGAPMCVLR